MAKLRNLGKYIYEYPQKLLQVVPKAVSYWYVRVYLIITLLVNITVWIAARFIVKAIDLPQIALHYNVDFGVDLYGNIANIYVIPLLGLVIAIINFIIILFLNNYKQSDVKFIFHLLLICSILTNIILLAAIISIYIINFR